MSMCNPYKIPSMQLWPSCHTVSWSQSLIALHVVAQLPFSHHVGVVVIVILLHGCHHHCHMGCHCHSVVVACMCAWVSHLPGSCSWWTGLHQCALDLMVHAGALREPAPANGINLIYEDDAGLVVTHIAEHLTHHPHCYCWLPAPARLTGLTHGERRWHCNRPWSGLTLSIPLLRMTDTGPLWPMV